MEKKIKHIFFDLDNTLWDTDKNSHLTLEKMYSKMKVEKNYKVNFKEFYSNYYERNEKLWSLFSQDKITKQDILDQRFNLTFKELGVENKEICDYFNDTFLDEVIGNNYMVENAEEILVYLKGKGYEIHVISNGFIKQTERKISGTPIKKYVTTVTSAEEINKRKPSKEVFDLGLKKAGAQALESSFIGDDWYADVIGSRDAGMYSVFFDYKKEEKYIQSGLPVVKDLIELKNIF